VNRGTLFAVPFDLDTLAVRGTPAPDEQARLGLLPNAAGVNSALDQPGIFDQGHEINSQRFVPPPRPMYSIGG
jgi:hypothetical protein